MRQPGSQEKAGETVLAPDYPPCVRAGKRITAYGKRPCNLFGQMRWVPLEKCQTCPLAGLLADAAKEAESKLWAAKPKGPRRNAPKVGGDTVDLTCVHRGPVSRTELCQVCGEKTKHEPIYACDLHGECALRRYKAGQKPKSCLSCEDRTPFVFFETSHEKGLTSDDDQPEQPTRLVHQQKPPRWSYGITTTPHRIDTLLPQTIRSLAAAGFDQPLLGVDNCGDCKAFERFGLPFTARTSHNHNHANWFLTAHEIYYRDPFADYYAIFEDDLVISRGARVYLERTMTEEKAYYSLFTNPDNERRPHPPHGWFMANQRGEGAVGLVFHKDAFLHLLGNVGTLLHARQIVNPRDGRVHRNTRGEEVPHGKEYVDGLIVSAMHQRGYVEWCHSPSIVQHVGHDSSAAHRRFPDAPSFRGEEFDLRELIK